MGLQQTETYDELSLVMHPWILLGLRFIEEGHCSVGCVNSLWLGDVYLVSTLVQVMAWCLMASSHYLNQCWFIINTVYWHSYQRRLIRKYSSFPSLDMFENYTLKITTISLRFQTVNFLRSRHSDPHFNIVIFFKCKFMHARMICSCIQITCGCTVAVYLC